MLRSKTREIVKNTVSSARSSGLKWLTFGKLLLTLFLVSLLPTSLPAVRGASPKNPIQHVVVMVQENHTFDNYFGTYPGANGVGGASQLPLTKGANSTVKPFALKSPLLAKDLCHTATCARASYNNGKMDGFVYTAGSTDAMGYYDYHHIPYYWDYASRYVLMDNYYSSFLGPSFPNHMYLMEGQSEGINHNPREITLNGTSIIDQLEEKGVSWRYYAQPYLSGWNPVPAYATVRNHTGWQKDDVDTSQFAVDLKNNRLADVSWIMPSDSLVSEHPPQNVTVGELRIVSLINSIMQSRFWNSTAIFLTWDDYGGWYDHVPPPQVDQDGYGFRVPTLIISPYSRHGYIDHTQADHTSILKFIQTLYGLESLTPRNLQAADLMEAFDFSLLPRAPLLLPGPYIPNHYPLTLLGHTTLMQTTSLGGAGSTTRGATKSVGGFETGMAVKPTSDRDTVVSVALIAVGCLVLIGVRLSKFRLEKPEFSA